MPHASLVSENSFDKLRRQDTVTGNKLISIGEKSKDHVKVAG